MGPVLSLKDFTGQPIQFKSGRLNENGKSVQLHTAKTLRTNELSRLYSEADCSYFRLVRIPF